MARQPKRSSRTSASGSKAAQAAQQQAFNRQTKNGGAFDASKMQVLHESDPIELPNDKDGVLSVRVYSYDGNDPRIGVYRVVWSVKQNREYQMRDLRPLDLEQSEQLHKELGVAIKFLKGLSK